MLLRLIRQMESNLSLVVFCAVLTGSIGLNLVLAIKYRDATTPKVSAIRVGASLKRIPTLDADGHRNEIVLDGAHWSVIYVMAPKCVWCARNLDNVRTIAAGNANAFHFVGLSNTAAGLDQYLASNWMPFPVQVVDKAHAPTGLDTTITPQMALVRPHGRVERVWTWALEGSQRAEAEEFFHVKLPGLREDDGTHK